MNAQLDKIIALPDVTLIAVTSVNITATVEAMKRSMSQAIFGAAKLLTDQHPSNMPAGVDHVLIPPLLSAQAYSEFILRRLVEFVSTSHCLLIQWDGHVIHGDRWRSEFLSYDYIGARWPQFSDGHVVGNGGFSLRSRGLLESCRDRGFRASHPEDLAIGRHNRIWLEKQGFSFAPCALADAFSAERAGDPALGFGYHGVWHMPQILGRETFWQIYSGLDEHTSVKKEFGTLLRQLAGGKGGARMAAKFIYDRIRDVSNQL